MRGKTSSSSTHYPKTQKDDDSQHPSYFISITIPQPKIRIKIPKLVANTMRKRFDIGPHNNTNSFTTRVDVDDNDERPKTMSLPSKPQKLLSNKVRSIFTNVFRTNKKPPPEEGSSNRSNSTSSEKCLDCGKSPQEFSRENSGSFRKKKKKKERSNAPTLMACNKGGGGGGGGNVVSRSVMVIGRRESAGKLIRVSSRVMETRRRVRKLESLKFDGNKERRDGVELCKKRILMGGKCKPLNISGTLRYDKNGILLPEVLS